MIDSIFYIIYIFTEIFLIQFVFSVYVRTVLKQTTMIMVFCISPFLWFLLTIFWNFVLGIHTIMIIVVCLISWLWCLIKCPSVFFVIDWLIYYFVKVVFRFIEKLRGGYRHFPHTPYSHTCLASPITNIPY